ncbi:FtsX-like permease family protein [Xylanimonas sp. McL0601]|uniref:FtsX-like permease family protein n=1 Tax=Xylanimonas sp. McL0601 TaxID=3414739 RepID=UPI003CF8C94C
MTAHARAVAREAIAVARSAPVASAVTVLAVAAMCVAVLLTQGRTAATQQQVLQTLDDAGSRTVTISAQTDAGITTSVIDRVAAIDHISWSGVFSGARDVVATDGGIKVALRDAYSTDLDTAVPAVPDTAFASPLALSRLGLIDRYGAVRTIAGHTYGVAGTLHTPEPLAFMEPLVLVPRTPTGTESVGLIVVLVDAPQNVSAVANAVTAVLGATDQSKVTVATSENLAALQTSVGATMSASSRILVLGILILTGLLIALLQSGLVLMRRKDYGRRRALGATRTVIVALVLAQIVSLAIAGALAGTLGTTVALRVTGQPSAPADFTLAIGVLAVLITAVGGLAPAVVAARRDPLLELRVP